MKISLDIDDEYEETTVTIQCREMDESVQEILDYFKGREQEFFVGKNGEMQHILKPVEIHYFYSKGDIVIAVTSSGEFKMKEKLYELEKALSSRRFIRLSKSVIANLYELSRFEASFNGTLCVYFKSGLREYVSRHYVPTIKEALKMKRRNHE